MNNTVVVSLGGSLLFAHNSKYYEKAGKKPEYDEKFLKELTSTIKEASTQVKLAIVVGGGALAKTYCEQQRKNGKNEFFADRAAITATIENAQKLAKTLGDNATIANSFDEASQAIENNKIALLHGMLEGITTDTVAVLTAERLDAQALVNASNINAIYDSDPNKNPKAKKFNSMTHKQLIKLAFENDDRTARTNFPFDLVASKLAARENLEIRFVNGNKAANIKKAILNQKFEGTLVKN
ncbi:MAG: UMP kinase [Candidatus Micrarchaeia archaeon]